MTVRSVVCCNGTWPGRPCRATYPSRAFVAKAAREDAQAHNWSQERNADFCPACTARKEREKNR